MVHAVVYLTPEMQEDLVGLGLEDGRMPYFAGRAAAMGPVGAGVVTATFGNFSAGLVGSVIPRAWTLVEASVVAAARFDSADRVLRRIWGESVIGSPEVADAADLARRATEGCAPLGRPLYAANADLAWPDQPHLVLWHAATLLREYRGDAHIAALVAGGLTGIEAIVTHTATGRGFREDFARTRRGWTQEEWDAAKAGLVERDLLEGEGGLTHQGARLRQSIEDQTDVMALPPWAAIGPDGCERLRATAQRLSDLVLASETQVQAYFADGSAFHRPQA